MSAGSSSNIGQKAIEIALARKRNTAHKLRSHSEVRRLAGRARVRAAVGSGPSKIVRVAITNTFDYSDYSAAISIGSKNAVVNVILDTGSSTLGVDPSAYDGTGDSSLVATTLGQLVTYGTGGWAGPVVKTTATLGGVQLTACPVAIAAVQEANNFQGVTGILGLAYYELNDDYDFKSYLAAHGGKSTYPWPLATGNWASAVKEIESVIQTYKLPQGTLAPYFDQLENQGVVANKFAFYVKRSWVSLQSANWKDDPLNQGFFILGGGEEQSDLYTGSFADVAVLDDVYYNTNLKSIQVGALAAVPAAALQPQYQSDSISNSIVDSGTSDLTLAADVYKAVLDGIGQTNSSFLKLVQQAQQLFQQGKGIPNGDLQLAAWPTIVFTLTGPSGEDVPLSCAPSTYWQLDFPVKGEATFQISGPLSAANQSILGLPLLNNYYTVFDRSEDAKGVVRFAPIKV